MLNSFNIAVFFKYEIVSSFIFPFYKIKRSPDKNKNYIKDFKNILNELDDSAERKIRSGSFDEKKKNKPVFKDKNKGKNHYAHYIDYSINKDEESVNYKEKGQIYKKSFF